MNNNQLITYSLLGSNAMQAIACFQLLGSLDLSAAFNVVNRDLLFKRMETMGIPDDLMALIIQ